jgi:putative FmdB family regulatory protein
MPLYEYHCNDCGDDFDKLVSFSQTNESQPCPSCGSQQTHKKISRPAVLGGNDSSNGGSCGSGGGFT